MSVDMLDAPAVPRTRTSSGDAVVESLARELPYLPEGEWYSIGGVSWGAYERLLNRRDSGHHAAKIAFHHGALTLMTVSNPHERWKKMIARLLETLSLALRTPIVGCGNISLRREDLAGGFEPDECYYIRHAATMSVVRPLDFSVDPPPDLAVEIELSRPLTDRLDLCRSLGLPEIWRFDGTTLRFWTLTAAGYEEIAESTALPGLTSADFQRFLSRTGTLDDTTLCLEFFDWVRANLTARTS
ncbi:Uma2 family endonuclease [Zavarzinella formosa]|uniref:Uma2 family endonuclease n=1 Tax=Zavarzinella formosa TaxID=360055 RepID=UPI0002F0CF7F|nr:Uma2 family endonuclease [Zavarzinella formosa]